MSHDEYLKEDLPGRNIKTSVIRKVNYKMFVLSTNLCRSVMFCVDSGQGNQSSLSVWAASVVIRIITKSNPV